MSTSTLLQRISTHGGFNFIVTNRLPRRAATRFMAWFSRIEQPVVRDLSIWIWQLFGGSLNLDEAKKSAFTSVHDCFVRELRPGVRPIDRSPETVISPCDAIVGECGVVRDGQLVQAKGITYGLADLLTDRALADSCRNGVFATLRLTSTMYHRFHAPYDCRIDEVIYLPGDTWNVNPPTLARKAGVFCLNERAIIVTRLVGMPASVLLVPVAAILVAGIHLEFCDMTFNLESIGPRRLGCRARAVKGEELGHFRHGSTIVVLGTPGLILAAGIRTGAGVKMGAPLFQRL